MAREVIPLETCISTQLALSPPTLRAGEELAGSEIWSRPYSFDFTFFNTFFS